MIIHIIWFGVLIFCFSVNGSLCDAVRFDFFVSVPLLIGCIQGVNVVIVQVFCIMYDVYCTVGVYRSLIWIMYIPYLHTVGPWNMKYIEQD